MRVTAPLGLPSIHPGSGEEMAWGLHGKPWVFWEEDLVWWGPLTQGVPSGRE